MKLGFTGTRRGMTEAQREAFLVVMRELEPDEFHHGNCIGADNDAHHLVTARFSCGGSWCRIVSHPPSDRSLCAPIHGHEVRQPRHYLIRNRDIVLETEHLVATPFEADPQPRGGTWSTVRYASLPR